MPKQRDLIHDFVEHEQFALIILDACRYDEFARQIGDHLDGDLQRVWASGYWTGNYTQETWTDEYPLTYFSSMPVISDTHFERIGRSYRPSNHFDRLVHCWDTDWDPELGTVPAERVTNSVLQYVSDSDSSQLVVHYAQPHVPYIGETEILPWHGKSNRDIQNRLNDDDQPSELIYSKIQRGEIPDETLCQAYRDNLEYVLKEVVRLVRHLDCPVVITSDHGEHLGENNNYLHYQDSVGIRQVPWYIVSGSEINNLEIEEALQQGFENPDEQQSTSEEVQERLESLGYT